MKFNKLPTFRLLPVPFDGDGAPGLGFEPSPEKKSETLWSIDMQCAWLLSDVLKDEVEEARRQEQQKARQEEEKQAQRKAEEASRVPRAPVPLRPGKWKSVRQLMAVAKELQVGTDGSRRAGRAYGRMSIRHKITLPDTVKRQMGIPLEARKFAYCFPLKRFASIHDSNEEELPINLELELHDTAARDQLGMSVPGDERSRVLRFLAVGGFIYFDWDNEVVFLATLEVALHDEKGLAFDKPLVSMAQPPSNSKRKGGVSQQEPRSKEAYALYQIGKRLRQRDEFCPPTLDFLRDRGVVGFCWIAPGEKFAGLSLSDSRQQRRKTVATAAQAEGTKGPFVDESDDKFSQIMHMEWQKNELNKQFDDEKADAEDLANKLWKSGAFVYMFDQPEDAQALDAHSEDVGDPDTQKGRFALFPVCDYERHMFDRTLLVVRFSANRAQKVVARYWKQRESQRRLLAAGAATVQPGKTSRLQVTTDT